MKTVHFIYALPQLRNPFFSTIQRVSQKLFHTQVVRGMLDEYRWPQPLKAPYSIAYYVARYLSQNYRTKLYDLREERKITPNSGDILIGHLWPNRKSIMWQSLDEAFSKRFIIGPYNGDTKQVGWMKPAIASADKYFAICGDYWIERFSCSPFSELKESVVHLNMALDSAYYPIVKKRFNKRGARGFFYVGRGGRFGDEKGIGLLEELAERIPGFRGGYICAGQDIAGWKKIAAPTELTPSLMTEIANEYDFFINMSRADAQATTVLEAMSWGFPVVCTKQTGYSKEEDIFYVSTVDMDENIELIEKLQMLSEDELDGIAERNRHVVIGKYNWQRFVNKLSCYI